MIVFLQDFNYLLEDQTKLTTTEPNAIAEANASAEGFLRSHDDLDLKSGVIKLKAGGGHGGHNGLKSIFENLGSQEFKRIRIGIDHPGDKK